MPGVDITALVQTTGYIGLFLIVFAESGLFFGFFLPGDSLLFSAGFLAFQGTLRLEFLVPILVVAAVSGDAVGYTFGRRVGRRLFERDESFLFRKKRLLQAEAFFAKHGGKAVVLARFLPLVRTFAPIVAGMGAMRYRRFVIFNVTGALLWVSSVTAVGYFAGSLFPGIDRYLTIFVATVVLITVGPAVIHFLIRNRREVLARLRPSRQAAVIARYVAAVVVLAAAIFVSFVIID
jgi:membrane-associated protein